MFLTLVVPAIVGCGGSNQGSSVDAARTRRVEGRVDAPSGVNPEELTLVTPSGEAELAADGSFAAEVEEERSQLVAAVIDGKEFALLHVVTSDTATIVLDARSTAEALTFLSPALTAFGADEAATVYAIIREDEEVSKLAEVIADVITGPDPASSPELHAALQRAIAAVVEKLPLDASESISAGLTIAQLPLAATSTCQGASQDACTVAELDLNHLNALVKLAGGQYDVTIESNLAFATDWLIDFAEVDPDDVDLAGGKGGLSMLGPGVSFDRVAGGTSARGYALGKSLFKYLDVIELAIDALVDLVGGQGTGSFRIAADKPAVYVARAYSGGFGLLEGGPEERVFAKTLPNGGPLLNGALTANAVSVVIDGIGVFFDVKKVIPDDLVAQFATTVVLKATQLMPLYFSEGSTPSPSVFVAYVGGVMVEALEVGAGLAAKQATKSLLGMLGKIGGAVFASAVDIPGKVAKGGEALDKAIDLVFQSTPLETVLVVVGDPFGPSTCTPDCTVLKCGPDPVCALSCGTCGTDEMCQGGSCIGSTVQPPEDPAAFLSTFAFYMENGYDDSALALCHPNFKERYQALGDALPQSGMALLAEALADGVVASNDGKFAVVDVTLQLPDGSTSKDHVILIARGAEWHLLSW
jgi:hypothetical protein